MRNLISSLRRRYSIEAVVIPILITAIAFLTPVRCHAQESGCIASNEPGAAGHELVARANGCDSKEARPVGSARPIEGTTAAPGGSRPAEHSLKKNKNEFSVWVGGSLGLPTALGGSRDRKIPLLIGLRYGRILAAGKYAALEYTFDIVPVALVTGPKGGFSNPGGLPSPGGGRDYAYGAGFIPVGFKLFVAPERRIKPYLTVSSGPFYFTKQVPVPDSAQFNFISTAGGGVQIFLSSRRGINVEYRVGHLSNAGVGNLNPGFNSSMIHAGLSVFR